ncbi:hypothetical protein [Pseudooceanicola algae]|uniref:Uncharacterized protein n=1 Tax=Pseudooceanicola algae TaxID=1537215 RepID=A0A418SK53_9RHOB|nr:hypothetical protein [Pseudooceanicola algae]QPM89150.1 hypothetical protein PSAL_003610 [Pseudooceanicola algae]
MILDRLGTLLARFGTTLEGRRTAAEHARTWRRARVHVPEIVPDLIAHGGLFMGQAVTMEGGVPSPARMDPCQLAYEAGRRDLAVQLLAAAGLTTTDLNELMREQDYDL